MLLDCKGSTNESVHTGRRFDTVKGICTLNTGLHWQAFCPRGRLCWTSGQSKQWTYKITHWTPEPGLVVGITDLLWTFHLHNNKDAASEHSGLRKTFTLSSFHQGPTGRPSGHAIHKEQSIYWSAALVTRDSFLPRVTTYHIRRANQS